MSPLKQLVKRRNELLEQLDAIKEQIGSVDCEIELMVGSQLAEVRRLQAKEFGAINVKVDGFKITETVPKKVSWDQEKMLDIFGRILASGDKPANYMRIDLSVPEKMYDGFADPVRDIFAEARTVTPGKTKIEIEEVAHAG